MKNTNISNGEIRTEATQRGERGSATIISVLILGLLTVFVALVLSKSANEARVMNNDADEGRTLYAAQASLETMTRNFNKIFEIRINPLASDLTDVQTGTVPGFTNYTFNQTLLNSPVGSQQILITGGEYQGLYAMRDNWVLQTTATSPGGAQVQLTRTFYNNRIPVFQFGIFYENDLTVHPGPDFNFGGRVHTNGNFYITPGANAYFDSRVSAAKEIVPELARDGDAWDTQWGEKTWIKNASGTWMQLKHDMGSVRNGPDIANNDPNVPDGSLNPAWAASKATFDGNLLDNVKPLYLPIRIASGDVAGSDNYRLIRRGRIAATGNTAATGGDLAPATSGGLPVPVTSATADSLVVATERYWGKLGIRISLGDRKERLPGCSNTLGGPVTDICGVRLDANMSTGDQDTTNYSLSSSTANRGYKTLPMIGTQAYQTSRLNAYRMYTGKSYDGVGRQTWIKVEIINLDVTTGLPKATDITRDFLSLGLTEQAPTTTGTGTDPDYTVVSANDFKLTGNATGTSSTGTLTAYDYTTSGLRAATDSRAILKMQHWGIAGAQINSDATATTTSSSGNYKYLASGTGWNVVTEYGNLADSSQELSSSNPIAVNASMRIGGTATGTGGTNVTKKVVPFPIELWDAREGVYNGDIDLNATYGANTVPFNGVMGIIDIDVSNFDRFLAGAFDNNFPNSGTPFAAAKGRGLRGSDIPINNGWLVYLSDRRGDLNFDGEYDMEDIFGPTDGIKQAGEDVNQDGVLNIGDINPYTWEGTKYVADATWGTADTYTELLNPANPTTTDRQAVVNKDFGAFADHRYYRRGFRLINGAQLPGLTDLATPANTRGFTISAEQAVYVQGNYNATSVASQGSPTPASDYLPQTAAGTSNTGQSPASIVADQIVFLSSAWKDGNDWASPFDNGGRVAADTTYRAAIMMGSSVGRMKDGSPSQGSGDAYLDGGVHNFINMRENWGGKHLNYCGSLISLWYSHNNNGAHKTGGSVYSPPDRNWVFDISFQDPTRLPPGTPSFQYVQITGFRRTNN
jgi:hypothetical protein